MITKFGDRLLRVYTWAIVLWLIAPVTVMILFGFNDTRSRSNTIWQGFTLKWYGRVFEDPDLTLGLVNSLTIAVISTVVTTALGLLLGLALGRYQWRGKGTANLLLFAAIAAPELCLGASLLSMFIQANVSRGYWTIVVAHVMFSLAFVAVVVRARVIGLDPSLEEAARDLGAGTWTTFRLVTLPMMMPAVTAGALLAFALSVDDFVITSFNNGTTTTFPLWIWGYAVRNAIPPQVNVMGTLIFAGGVLLALANVLAARRRRA